MSTQATTAKKEKAVSNNVESNDPECVLKVQRDATAQCLDFEARHPEYSVRRKANSKGFALVQTHEAPSVSSAEFTHYAAYRVSVKALATCEAMLALINGGLATDRLSAKQVAAKKQSK